MMNSTAIDASSLRAFMTEVSVLHDARQAWLQLSTSRLHKWQVLLLMLTNAAHTSGCCSVIRRAAEAEGEVVLHPLTPVHVGTQALLPARRHPNVVLFLGAWLGQGVGTANMYMVQVGMAAMLAAAAAIVAAH